MATDKIINTPYSMQQIINEVLGHLIYDEIGTIKLIPVTATLLSGYLDINVNISKSDYSELWQKIQNDSWVSKALATDVNTTTFKINSQSAPSNFKYIIKAKNIVGIDPTIHQANANFLDGLAGSAFAKTLGNPLNAFQVANAVNLNEAVSLAQFTGFLSANGYIKIPTWDITTNTHKEIIIQWGNAYGNTTGVAVLFPMTFPNNCFALTSNNAYSSNVIFACTTVTKSGFVLSQSAYTGMLTYIVIGN